MTDLTRREVEFLLYQTEGGQTRIEVRFDGETAWLSLGEGEPSSKGTVAESATVQRGGSREVTREQVEVEGAVPRRAARRGTVITGCFRNIEDASKPADSPDAFRRMSGVAKADTRIASLVGLAADQK